MARFTPSWTETQPRYWYMPLCHPYWITVTVSSLASRTRISQNSKEFRTQLRDSFPDPRSTITLPLFSKNFTGCPSDHESITKSCFSHSMLSMVSPLTTSLNWFPHTHPLDHSGRLPNNSCKYPYREQKATVKELLLTVAPPFGTLSLVSFVPKQTLNSSKHSLKHICFMKPTCKR